MPTRRSRSGSFGLLYFDLAWLSRVQHDLGVSRTGCFQPFRATRAFKDHFGMTPHAYVINCRIEFSRAQLRHGRPIGAVALEAGFADQAHLQRTFKRFIAATPAQYRG